jgi:hypothetical protein
MARRLERAVELEQLAFAAAEEATANTEQATARLAQVETEATERVAAAEADRDRVDNEAEAVLTESRVHVDAARAGQARAEGERDAAQAAARAAAEENVRLRRTLDEQIAGHRRQIEARDLEYARAITAAHAIADRAAREHRAQLSELLYQHAAQPASQPGVADEVDQRG